MICNDEAARPSQDQRRVRLPRWAQMSAFAVAASITAASGFGLGTIVGQTEDAGPATVPMSFYITDAPRGMTKLDVSLASVKIGPQGIPLPVVKTTFDLASLRGPDQAILIAKGDVPADAVGAFKVEFSAARATVDGVVYDLPPPAPLVVEQVVAPATDAPAMLVDIDLNASVLIGDDGEVSFVPVAGAVYAAPQPGEAALAAGTPPAWKIVEARTQEGLSIGAQAGVPVPEATDRLPDLNGTEDSDLPAIYEIGDDPQTIPDAGADAVEDAVEGVATDLEDKIDEKIVDDAAEDAQDAAGTASGWLVLFAQEASRSDMQDILEEFGVVMVNRLQTIPVAYALATEEQAQLMAEDPRIAYVEAEVPIEYHDAESRKAIRIPELVAPATGLRDAAGNQIDGRGIGVAVVDNGIDGLHPDLPYAPLFPGGVLVANYKVESAFLVPTPSSDTTSGHGTHVAAIVAGQASDPAQKGIAPGAKLYGFGIGEASTTVWAAQAFDWIIANGANQDPPIKVVTNSWSAGYNYNPNSVTSRLVDRMVQEDMVVVFSAGNRGGNGLKPTTSAQCQIPTAGVICVAAYDDQQTGTRDGTILSSSSRGAINQPSTWPDVSAPGYKIMSARPLAGTETGIGLAPRVELSGTSQAAPHVAAVAALLLQKADLSPAEVEAQIKSTAYKFTDGGGYTNGSHYAKGAGLLDAYAAVQAAG